MLFRVARSSSPRWPETYVAGVRAFALMEKLSAEILASTSATRALEAWCRAHRLSDEPNIVVELLQSRPASSESEHRRWLRPLSGETVTHRRVRLRCGRRVVAEADNWYLAGRLTPDINRVLETTDTPFGTAIASLAPSRCTIAVRSLWAPHPASWDFAAEMSSGLTAPPIIPASLFRHSAVIYAGGQTPISFVEEVYKRSLLPDHLGRWSVPATARFVAVPRHIG